MFDENWRSIPGIARNEEAPEEFTSEQTAQLTQIAADYRRSYPDARDSAVEYQSKKILRERIRRDAAYAAAAKAKPEPAKVETTEVLDLNTREGFIKHAELQRPELLRKQAEAQDKEEAERKRLQDIGKATVRPCSAPGLSDEQVAAVKARQTAPDRWVPCPNCHQSCQLVNGVLPKTHRRIVGTSIDGYEVSCNPYGN